MNEDYVDIFINDTKLQLYNNSVLFETGQNFTIEKTGRPQSN